MDRRGGEAGRRALLVLLLLAPPASAQTISYTVTIPAPAQHWLQVEATFPGLGEAPLRAFMSRSSPGRYSLHDFAKNVFWLEAFDGRGRALALTRPNPYQWDVSGHDGTVRLVYRVFGNTVDGTYLGVDSTHAHMNMPAAFLFDLDHQDRPIEITFTPPVGQAWQVATQLFPTPSPFTFTAPNLQYFMDSPVEFSAFVRSTFSVPNGPGRTSRFHVVAHTDATQADVDELAALIERLVREQQAVFGEFPEFESGAYTFLLDYRAGNGGDGMEHRNSTVITSSRRDPLKTPEGRRAVLPTISHEFFHAWNVERIRPEGLEPFDFTRANVTCCLWLAEGFTDYYGDLLLARAGVGGFAFPDVVGVINGSGRQVRSPIQMSQHAPFVDRAGWPDATDQSRSFISYYSYGAVLALGLDLSLRERTAQARSLDDVMRALWRRFGAAAPPAAGLVAMPYGLADLREVVAEVAGDRPFADGFFSRYIDGRDLPDFAPLLRLAGYDLRLVRPGESWTGVEVYAAGGSEGLIVRGARDGGGLVPFGTPAFDAGLEQQDVISAIDGRPATMAAWGALSARPPGERVVLTVVHPGGVRATVTLVLAQDPALAIGDLGASMTPAQRAFRDAWLGARSLTFTSNRR